MQSWLSTFREPDIPPIADLANRIVKASLNGAETLKPSLVAADEEDRTRRWFTVICEFLYFFMHLTNRFAYAELGHEQRCKIQKELYPLIVRPTIESIFGHWPPKLKDGLENDFVEKLNDAEVEYGECKQLLDSEHPLSCHALFPKFASNICELLGLEKSDVTYLQTFMEVTTLALHSFTELNPPEAVRGLGKEA